MIWKFKLKFAMIWNDLICWLILFLFFLENFILRFLKENIFFVIFYRLIEREIFLLLLFIERLVKKEKWLIWLKGKNLHCT